MLIFMEKLSQFWKPWKTQKFSPVNISLFMVYKNWFIPCILSSYFGGKQHNLLCSVLTSSQSHIVTKSLFCDPFQIPLFTTTVGCRVIITSSTAIVLIMHIYFVNVLSTWIEFNWPPPFWVAIWPMSDCYNCLCTHVHMQTHTLTYTHIQNVTHY